MWVAVGGNPESAMRAGTLGLPLAIAIIGGQPERFVPFAELHRAGGAAAGHGRLRGEHQLARLRRGDRRRQAADEFFPPYAAMMTAIGRERGWSPMQRPDFDAAADAPRRPRRRQRRRGRREDPLPARASSVTTAFSMQIERRRPAARAGAALDRASRDEGGACGARRARLEDEALEQPVELRGGSPQTPVCTADGWMIVLDGATSQWKRAVVSSCAIGPPSASPAAIRSIASRCARTASRSSSGAERGEPRARRAACARRGSRAAGRRRRRRR